MTLRSLPVMGLVPESGIASEVIFDAGGDTSSVLTGALYRCIDDMLNGQMLHLISGDVRSREDVPRWCAVTEHELIATCNQGNETLFWIRKR